MQRQQVRETENTTPCRLLVGTERSGDQKMLTPSRNLLRTKTHRSRGHGEAQQLTLAARTS